MYRVIAYHGKGNKGEVENDLRLLWDSLRCFVKSKDMQHVYCFQVVKDKEGVSLLLVLQYENTVSDAKPRQGCRELASGTDVDYWFYVREK